MQSTYLGLMILMSELVHVSSAGPAQRQISCWIPVAYIVSYSCYPMCPVYHALNTTHCNVGSRLVGLFPMRITSFVGGQHPVTPIVVAQAIAYLLPMRWIHAEG